MWIRSRDGILVDTGGAFLQVADNTVTIMVNARTIVLADFANKAATERQFASFQSRMGEKDFPLIFEFPKED
jgi:hypothetical protein